MTLDSVGHTRAKVDPRKSSFMGPTYKSNIKTNSAFQKQTPEFEVLVLISSTVQTKHVSRRLAPLNEESILLGRSNFEGTSYRTECFKKASSFNEENILLGRSNFEGTSCRTECFKKASSFNEENILLGRSNFGGTNHLVLRGVTLYRTRELLSM